MLSKLIFEGKKKLELKEVKKTKKLGF